MDDKDLRHNKDSNKDNKKIFSLFYFLIFFLLLYIILVIRHFEIIYMSCKNWEKIALIKISQ